MNFRFQQCKDNSFFLILHVFSTLFCNFAANLRNNGFLAKGNLPKKQYGFPYSSKEISFWVVKIKKNL